MMAARCANRSPRFVPWPAVVSNAIRNWTAHGGAENSVEIVGDARQAGLFAGPQMRAGVQHDERHAERIRPPHFVHQRRDRALGGGGGQVDEIRTVREDGDGAAFAELLNFVGGVRRSVSLYLVFQKNLGGFAAGRHRAVERAGDAAGNADMGAEWRHSLIFRTRLTKSN